MFGDTTPDRSRPDWAVRDLQHQVQRGWALYYYLGAIAVAYCVVAFINMLVARKGNDSQR
jgi:hypothetical protein